MPTLKLLSAGINPTWFATHKSVPLAPINAALATSTKEMASIPGVQTDFADIDPADADTVSKFRQVVKEGNYDGISIGWGLRQLPEQSALFEAVVNVCREESPGSRLSFNRGPDDIRRGFARQFPEIGE